MLSTFRIAREAYLADLRISKSQKTYEQYELVLRKFDEWLEQTYVEQPQEQITPLTITAWKQAVAERGVKQNTIIHYLMILKSFFRWSIANRFYSEQPVEDEVFPQEEEIKHDIPTLDEIQLLLSGKIPPRTPHALRNLAIVTLFIESGMRVSELCALKRLEGSLCSSSSTFYKANTELFGRARENIWQSRHCAVYAALLREYGRITAAEQKHRKRSRQRLC